MPSFLSTSTCKIIDRQVEVVVIYIKISKHKLDLYNLHYFIQQIYIEIYMQCAKHIGSKYKAVKTQKFSKNLISGGVRQ
jgi:hypothetical protein